MGGGSLEVDDEAMGGGSLEVDDDESRGRTLGLVGGRQLPKQPPSMKTMPGISSLVISLSMSFISGLASRSSSSAHGWREHAHA